MFRYDKPVNPSILTAAAPIAPSRASGFNVSELLRGLWRRKVAIVTAGLICACAAVMIGKSITPRYAATAQLYVDPRELQLVDRELTPRSQDGSGLSMVVESQARLIASNNVLLRVIEAYQLDKDAEFGGPSTGLLGSLMGFVSFGNPPPGDAKLGRTEALEALRRHLSVKRTDRTYVIDIEVWSNDPGKAATIANAISNAYLDESRQSQAVAARRATADLSGRLNELQDRLRTAETALAVYKAKNNFVGTQDTMVSDQQLLTGSQRLAAAKALTLDAKARYEQIEASRRAATDAGAIPEALQSPTIAGLRAQYAETRRRHAEMKNEFGPLHPSLRNMEKQVEDVKRNIDEEVSRYAQAAKNDLARARDYEASLKGALDTQKQQSVDLSQASVRLRELERDVEAGRNVYQSFLKRSRETEEQESLNTSSARVIGEATKPPRRAFPPAMSMIAIIGFMIGASGAAALTVAADRLTARGTSIPSQHPAPQPDLENAPRVAKEPPDLGRILKSPTRQNPIEDRPSVVGATSAITIARLRESDVLRSLTSILAPASAPDLTKLGWPTLRAGSLDSAFVRDVRQIRLGAAKRGSPKAALVLAVIGPSDGDERAIVALNVALASARDGARVLMVDADHIRPALSMKMARYHKPSDSPRWIKFGAKSPVAIETEHGIAVLSSTDASKTDWAIRAIADARASERYDLVILDGPAMPLNDSDRALLGVADGAVASLSTTSDIHESLDAIIAALGGREDRICGVIVDELLPGGIEQQRASQYA